MLRFSDKNTRADWDRKKAAASICEYFVITKAEQLARRLEVRPTFTRACTPGRALLAASKAFGCPNDERRIESMFACMELLKEAHWVHADRLIAALTNGIDPWHSAA